MAILSSQATRRDAKSYFGRFGGQDLYSNVHKQLSTPFTPFQTSSAIHIALVKLCKADTLSSVGILPGLAKTLVQLGKLGMPVCLIVEPEDSYAWERPLSSWNSVASREKHEALTNRIAVAIESQGGRALPIVGEILAQNDSSVMSQEEISLLSTSETVSKLERSIMNPAINMAPGSKKLIYDSLKRGQIPVVAPVAGGIMPSLLPISADCALYHICQGISGSDGECSTKASIERVIIIDPIGGLPAAERRGGSHIYINLRQEYDGMINDMSSQLLSKDETTVAKTKAHLRNLLLVKLCLALLHPTSSALITTPTLASAVPSKGTPQSLIHNLLTDKPLISPSLPARRPTTPTSSTTLLRNGLPVVVYDSIDSAGNDGRRLDYARLVKLIEDSFGKHLDIDHYHNRIHDKTAAVIVAGDYEGAAIVTKESAPKASPGTWIPYLDKFAVSTKSQGSGGVADIVFNVLTSTFSDNLIWRSRKSNPVNKWVLSSYID